MADDDGIFNRLGRMWDRVANTSARIDHALGFDPLLDTASLELAKSKFALADALPEAAALLRKNAAGDIADVQSRHQGTIRKTNYAAQIDHALGLDPVLDAVSSKLATSKLALADALPEAAALLRKNAAGDIADVQSRHKTNNQIHGGESVHSAPKAPVTPSAHAPKLREI